MIAYYGNDMLLKAGGGAVGGALGFSLYGLIGAAAGAAAGAALPSLSMSENSDDNTKQLMGPLLTGSIVYGLGMFLGIDMIRAAIYGAVGGLSMTIIARVA